MHFASSGGLKKAAADSSDREAKAEHETTPPGNETKP
jgi:hypothetical protein